MQHLGHGRVDPVQQYGPAEPLGADRAGLRHVAQRHGLLGEAVPLPAGPHERGASYRYRSLGQTPLCFGYGGGKTQLHDNRPAFPESSRGGS